MCRTSVRAPLLLLGFLPVILFTYMSGKKRKLTVQQSHDVEPVACAVNARTQELKVIGELRGQRHYKENLQGFFTKPIDAKLTWPLESYRELTGNFLLGNRGKFLYRELGQKCLTG